MTISRKLPGLLTLLLVLPALLAAAPAPAASPEGTGESYWGTIPAPADTSTAVFPDQGESWWVYPVRLPYYVVAAPLTVLFEGFETATVYLDESGVIRTVGGWLAPVEAPWGGLLSVEAGGLHGFGGGVGFFHNHFLAEGNLLKVRASATTEGSVKTHFGIVIPGEEGELSFGAGYRVRPKARYFGIGPETVGERDGEDRESYFTQETTWAGMEYQRRLGNGFAAEALGIFTAAGARDTRAEELEEALQTRYADEAVPGFRDRSDGVNFGLSLLHDDTLEDGRPNRGGHRRASIHYFTSVGDYELDYWTFRFEAQQFLPLWLSRRSLALRGVLAWIERDHGDVPIQRLYTNDDPDLFRGYNDYRWRDTGLTLFTAEYRWPIWANTEPHDAGLDAYLFSDLGQVFGEFREISLRNLTVSGGTGVRLMGRGGFTGLAEIGFSDEETVFRVKAEQVFQYEKNGFYHGRNPIPIR